MRRGEQIIQQVKTWPQVTVDAHQFGGVEFNYGKVEIGHIHGDTLIDIPYTRTMRDLLVRDGETRLHHVLPESGWTSFYLHKDEDVAQALKLLRLSYIQKRIRRVSTEDRHAFIEEIRQLQFSPDVQRMVMGDHDAEALDQAQAV